jgi:hypothetical protein
MKTHSGSNDSMRDNQPKATGSSAEENSVTFSLSALMAQGTQAPASQRSGSAAKDDSGLIDLNALSAMEDNVSKLTGVSSQPVASRPSHMGLFSLDAPSVATPLSAAVQLDEDEPKKKPSRAWIWIAGGGVAVAAVAAFFIGMNGGNGEHAQGAPGAGAGTASPAAVVPAVLESQKAAEPAKVAAVDPGAPKEVAKEATKETPKTIAVKAPGTQAKFSSTRSDSSEKAAKPEEKKAPAGDPCKGDLMCAMQRATKK